MELMSSVTSAIGNHKVIGFYLTKTSLKLKWETMYAGLLLQYVYLLLICSLCTRIHKKIDPGQIAMNAPFM